MRKKVSEFTKRQRAIKECGDHIDPTTCTTRRFECIETILRSPRFDDPDSREFQACNNAIQYLLGKAIVLNKQPFWDELDYPSGKPAVPLSSASNRHEKLSKALEQVRFDDSDHEDLGLAIEALEEAITSMQLQFAYGTVSDGFEGCPAEMRYMCAAMLSAMSSGIAKVVRQAVASEGDGKTVRRAT